MSLYGTHSDYTKQQAALLLPKGHCKSCNYFVRILLQYDSTKYFQDGKKCTRCSSEYKILDILYKARQLKIIDERKQIDG